ncbi:MAG TPA: ABC transporter permease subunit [Bryobacteraceae bacterium]|nr:ABC transporter permease subunit [Bryobacteraceae bacterium]
MTWARRIALLLLAGIALAGAFAPVIAPYPYDEQFRDAPDASPGPRFLMGTDEIGRDRLSRLIYATRVSVLLAPAAALVSIALALLIAAAGSRFAPGAFSGLTTICLALPWIFLFIILRAELPLNTEPGISVLLTFGLMGVAGWAWPARVFSASIQQMTRSGWLLQARAAGMAGWRIAVKYAWPHLRAVAAAQFRILIPAYVLSEASLGLLGLGVSDPLPSWGNLLRDLQRPDVVRSNPWVLAPLGILMIAMVCLELLQPSPETAS